MRISACTAWVLLQRQIETVLFGAYQLGAATYRRSDSAVELIDQTGQQRTHNQTTDALFLYRPSLLPSGARMLIAPGLFLQETLAQSGFVGSGADTAQRDVEELEGSTSSSVTLDTIIFEDGTVIGPDQSETIASLSARKTAADSIVQAARQAKAAGRDVSAVFLTSPRGVRTAETITFGCGVPDRSRSSAVQRH